MEHELKIHPEYFEAVLSGEKRFEFRKCDREYQVGDVLHLKEWDPKKKVYTGREIVKKVLYVYLIVPSLLRSKLRWVIMSIGS
jgi:ASC-1-like (ASCH) protein